MTTECPHGDDTAICPPCNKPLSPLANSEPATTISARYSSFLGCGHYVEEGDWIHCIPEDGWICEECA